jgi:hypothetical protein
MKILIYSNRKCDPIYFDASTPEKEKKAYLALFKILDESWKCYSFFDVKEEGERLAKREHELAELTSLLSSIKEIKSSTGEEVVQRRIESIKADITSLRNNVAGCNRHKDLAQKARKGDAKACKQLLNERRNYEYEEFKFADVQDP